METHETSDRAARRLSARIATGLTAAVAGLVIAAAVTLWDAIPEVGVASGLAVASAGLAAYLYGRVWRPIEAEFAGLRLALAHSDQRLAIEREEALKTQRVLEAARDHLESLIENAPVSISAHGAGSEFVLVNKKATEYYGRPAEDLIGQPLAQFASHWPGFNDSIVPATLRVVETNEPETLETQLFHERDGELRTVRLSLFPVFRNTRNGPRMISLGSIAVDMTDILNARREAEQASAELRRQRTLFRAFVDNAPLAMAAKRRDGSFIFANRRLADSHGLPVEAMPSVDVEALRRHVPGFEDNIFKPGQRSIDTGETITVEADVFSRLHEEVRTMQFTFFPIEEQVDGEPRITDGGMICFDVTDIRRAQREEAQVNARLTQFIEHAPVGVSLADLDGRMLIVNQATANYFGVPPDAIVGRNYSEMKHLWPASQEGAVKALIGRVGSGRMVRFATRFDAPVGRAEDDLGFRIMDMTFFPIRNDHGDVVEIGSFATDITQIRVAQDKLAAQQSALHQAEKLAALGQLLAGVAHELNNPLTVVVGRSAILEEKLAGTSHERAIVSLREAADRCNRIVRTFLAMARQSAPRRGRVQLHDVVEAALDMTAYGIRSAGIELERAFAEDLPEVEVDEDQMVQVITNLLINAQHALEAHTGRRQIRINTRCEAGHAILEVEDSGPGVPPDLEQRIFEPFFTTKDVGQGTGMGLAMARGMIEEQGGALTHSPVAGGGARFAVSLPIAESARETSEVEAEPERPGKARGRALIIDDEDAIRSMLAELLAASDIECVEAQDGAEALARLNHESFDVIISDVRMPGMDGLQMRREIAASRPELLDRLVFMSGDVMQRAAARHAEIAGHVFIEKPFNPAEVRRVVLAILEPSEAKP